MNKFGYQASKVTLLADTLSQAISHKEFREGEPLPSINQLSQRYQVSRDTVFKAFQNLRERKLIDSIPGKGYYVVNQVTNVLLLLDEYTPFKESLYNSFIKHLPTNFKVDLLFHQYNEPLFNTLINQSIGKYNKYIVMNFNNEQLSCVLKKITPSKLLLLDFGNFDKDNYSYICQDFDQAFYKALIQLKERLHRYRQLVFVFPPSLKHPASSKAFFTRFAEKEGFACRIHEEAEHLKVEANTAYIAIKQQDVVRVIKEGRKEGLKCGKDFGLLAYNDIPSYEVIDEGITTLSINWEMAGNEIARFVLNHTTIQRYLPTEIHLRKSL